MKRIITLAVAAVLGISALSGCAGNDAGKPGTTGDSQAEPKSSQKADAGQLNLFTWEGMFPPELMDGFERETGVRINYVNFDYDETMLEKLAAAGGGDYDLVIADDYIIETVIEQGLAQKLDRSKLSNYDNINPVFQGQFFDPDDEYTVPHGAGIQTIVYDPAAVDIEIKGYQDLWDESLRDNIGIIGNHRVINGMALKILGRSYNTQDESEIAEAGELLKSLAPNIRLIRDDSMENDLLSGEISAAVMYTSMVTAAKLANPDLEVVFPDEGIGFGIMAGFIPSNAPHPDAAYAFLDYLLKPEHAADAFEWLGYYCTNRMADPLISEEYKSFLTLPQDIDESKMEMIENVDAAAEDLHTKIWTEFKTATGN